jgi:hypothetical protein
MIATIRTKSIPFDTFQHQYRIFPGIDGVNLVVSVAEPSDFKNRWFSVIMGSNKQLSVDVSGGPPTDLENFRVRSYIKFPPALFGVA